MMDEVVPPAIGAIGILLADGRLPTGGHAHSVGLEAAVRVGEVTDMATLERFALARLDTQGRVDGSFAAAGARTWAEHRHDRDLAESLDQLTAEFDARALSPHLRDAARTLGRHLLRVAGSLVPDPTFVRTHLRGAPRPIVAGAVVAELGLPSSYAATVECHHLVSGVCGGAVKLLGLDPLAIVGLQARLASHVDAIVAEVDRAELPNDLAAAASTRSEILAEWHAADPTRLFAT